MTSCLEKEKDKVKPGNSVREKKIIANSVSDKQKSNMFSIYIG